LKLRITKDDIERELARRDIRYFVRRIQPSYCFAPFNIAILDALETFLKDTFAGKRPILVIQAPPQHGKSQLASRHFPAYAFGKNPNLRIAGCSYGADLAIEINRDIQATMMGGEYQKLFPQSSLNTERVKTRDNLPLRNTETFDIVSHKGRYVCCGIGGALTGKSVDIGIIDDPIKNMVEARSPTIKAGILSWYRSVFLTRLSKNSAQLIMATRWAVDDLIGFIIDTYGEQRVKILKFPAIDKDGRALLPALHPLEQLEEHKKILSEFEWQALYQQEPIIEGGNLIKTDEFKTYTELPPLLYTKVFADTAMTVKRSSDFTVFGLFGYDFNGNCYLLDMWRGKWESPDVLNLAQELWTKFENQTTNTIPKPRSLAIENKANGIHIVQELKKRKISVEFLEPKSIDYMGRPYIADKTQRVMDILPLISVGRFYVPHETLNKHWIKDFILECQSFSADMQHKHDDQVDVLVYALKELISGRKITIDNLAWIRG
jgi:predicted phage terminase large subunit-like protein